MMEEQMMEKQWVMRSQFGQEKNIVQAIAESMTTGEICPHRLDDMLTSIAEACLNALEHGNLLDESLPVKVTMQVTDLQYIFRIYDHGPGYADMAPLQPDAMMNKLQGDDSPRGWGLYLIEALSDEVSSGCDESGLFYTEIHFDREQNGHAIWSGEQQRSCNEAGKEGGRTV